jgi:hypothetical protein
LPTHAWYVGYAPLDNHRSPWPFSLRRRRVAGPRRWLATWPPTSAPGSTPTRFAGTRRPGGHRRAEAAQLPSVCDSTVFNPTLPQTEAEIAAEDALLEQIQPTPIPVAPGN